MKMNPVKKVLAGAGGVATLALIGAGMFGVQDASAGIANTKHNLGTATVGGTVTRINSFGGTGEICVFCHTPHGSDTTAAVPLWNRALPTDLTTYTTYNSLGTSTLEGATVQVGSVSIACLSCHDGTQAMNSVINRPGSGLYSESGAQMTGTWSGTNQTDGKIATGIITNIGKDLRNDHPIGIQYAGGFKSTTGVTAIPSGSSDYTNTNFNDPDFNTAKSKELNGQQVWWVDVTTTGTSGSRDKTDMLLYSRKGDIQVTSTNTAGSALTGGAQPFVECASCHDPHTENVTFLRVSNSGSAVCLACHIK